MMNNMATSQKEQRMNLTKKELKFYEAKKLVGQDTFYYGYQAAKEWYESREDVKDGENFKVFTDTTIDSRGKLIK